MDYRSLGRTGMQVSPLCLGAMMFGAWGEPDHDTSVGIIHPALDAGHQLHRHRRRVLAGRVGGDRRQGAGRRPPRRRRPGDQVPRADGGRRRRADGHRGDPNSAATRGAGSCRRSRTACAGCRPTGSTSTRCTGPTRHRRRGDAGRADRPAARRQDPRVRLARRTRPTRSSRRSGSAERRGLGRFVTEQPPYSMLVRGIEADLLPVAEQYGMGVLPWSPLAGGWLSGRYRKGQDAPTIAARRADAGPLRPVHPDNQPKLEAADALAALAEEAGHLAGPPGAGVRAAAPGGDRADHRPRTMDHLDSQLGAADVTLSARRARPDRRDRAAGGDAVAVRRRVRRTRAQHEVPAPPHGLIRDGATQPVRPRSGGVGEGWCGAELQVVGVDRTAEERGVLGVVLLQAPWRPISLQGQGVS